MIRSLCLAGLVGLAGCGLIDSGGDELDFDLPAREVTVDTSDWELTDAGKFPSVTCEASTSTCASQVETWCGADDICSARCGGETCEIRVRVELWHTFILAQEQLELQALSGAPLSSLTIDRIRFAVIQNTLSRPSPELTVSVASQGVMSIEGEGAEEIGTIPAIEPGRTVPDGELILSADGQASLARRMRDYETPFNLILGGRLEMHANDDVPTGRLVVVVKATAHASVEL